MVKRNKKKKKIKKYKKDIKFRNNNFIINIYINSLIESIQTLNMWYNFDIFGNINNWNKFNIYRSEKIS